MDAQLKAEWVEALRSGEYHQADGALRRYENEGYSYCCLGVLCATMGATWKSGEPILGDVNIGDTDEELLGETGLRLTGLDNKTQQDLAGMNDQGKSFPEIADFIEQNL